MQKKKKKKKKDSSDGYAHPGEPRPGKAGTREWFKMEEAW
jgi:hypothetical protein